MGAIVGNGGNDVDAILESIDRQDRRKRRRRIITGSVLALVCALIVSLMVIRAHMTRTDSAIPAGRIEFGRVCGSPGTAYTSLPPYGGTGRHPWVMVFFASESDMAEEKPIPMGEAYPYDENKPENVQLVLCVVLQLHEHVTWTVCHDFDEGIAEKIALHDATYRVTVREARTHRKVGVVTVPGDWDICLSWMRDPRIMKPFRWPKAQTWDAMIGKYYDGPPVHE